MFSASGILLRKRALTRGLPVGANEGLGGLGGGVSMITSGSCCAQSRCCSSPSSIVVRNLVSVRGRMLKLYHVIRQEQYNQSQEKDCKAQVVD